MSLFRCVIQSVGLSVVLASVLCAAEPAKSLRDVLAPEVFKKAGLEKLTPAELSYLSVQLFGERGDGNTAAAGGQSVAQPESKAALRQGVIASLPSGEAAFGQEEKLAVEVVKIQRVPDEIRSRIAGRFEGWSGHTVFTLENGQQWRQVESGNFEVNLDSPEVLIKKGMFGTFYIRVVGYGSSVKVKRVK